MAKLNWEYYQKNANAILSDGLFVLKQIILTKNEEALSINAGNYLISLCGKPPYYIGQAKNVKKRAKQEFNLKYSTFYKGLRENTRRHEGFSNLEIGDFHIQAIETRIGRKELEEFGIVNLPAVLNKFHIDKRPRMEIDISKGVWKIVQETSEEVLSEGEKLLFQGRPVGWFDATIPITPGIYYVLYKAGEMIYIGESSDINERHSTHTGTTYFSALRRHIGTDMLGFKFVGKKKFSDKDDAAVTNFLRNCKICFMPVEFGRLELEEKLIKSYNPTLNRKVL